MNTDNSSNLPALPLDRTLCVQPVQGGDDGQPRVLDVWVDNIYFIFDVRVSEETMERILAERLAACDVRDERKAVYVSEWFNASISPSCTTPVGILAACEEVCTFIREYLLADTPDLADTCTTHHARCSWLDLHIDWQGG